MMFSEQPCHKPQDKESRKGTAAMPASLVTAATDVTGLFASHEIKMRKFGFYAASIRHISVRVGVGSMGGVGEH